MKLSFPLTRWFVTVALLSSASAFAFGEKMPEGFTAEKAGVLAEDLGRVGPDEIRQAWVHLGNSTVLDLNLRAAEFWNRLVACQESAEAARQAYLGGERLCMDEAKNTELKTVLSALSQDFQTLITTAPLPEPTSLAWRQTFPLIHPFLAELAIEAIATIHHEVQNRYRNPSGDLRRPITAYHLPSSVRCVPDTIETPARQTATSPCNAESSLWEKRYWNAKRILAVPSNLAAIRGCARFGLWPNASLATSAILNYGTGRSEIHDYRGVAHGGRVAPDLLAPSCWQQGTREMLIHMNGNWVDPARDRSTLDVALRHAQFIDQINARYVKIRQSWQNQSSIQQSPLQN